MEFLILCEKAKSNPNNKYFFIIDEINRGNLSKIFGELMMLIEADKEVQIIKYLSPTVKKKKGFTFQKIYI